MKKVILFLLSIFILIGSTTAIEFNPDEVIDDAKEQIDKAENITQESQIDDQIVNTSEKLGEEVSDSNITRQITEVSLQDIQTNAETVELDNSTKTEIKHNIKVASRKLPEDKDERRQITIETANEICQESPRLKEIQKALTEGDNIQRQAKRMEKVADILNTRMEMTIDSGDFNRLYTASRDVTQYAPLIGSYSNLVNKSCAVEKGNDESINEFYKSAAYFSAEVVLIEAGVTYKTSSKAVRYMNSRAGMARIRGVCGDECYSFVLSEAHWAVRGAQNKMKNQVLYESKQIGMPLDEDKVSELVSNYRKPNNGNRATGKATQSQGIISMIMSLLPF